jgi:hypothetical protein
VRQPLSFAVCHLPGIPSQHFNSAGGTASIAATAVQNVDSAILKGENQSRARVSLKRQTVFY